MCVYVCVHAHVYAYAYACVYVYVCVRVYVCIYIYIYIHIHICVYMYIWLKHFKLGSNIVSCCFEHTFVFSFTDTCCILKEVPTPPRLMMVSRQQGWTKSWGCRVVGTIGDSLCLSLCLSLSLYTSIYIYIYIYIYVYM